jgi:hypothetical protein
MLHHVVSFVGDTAIQLPHAKRINNTANNFGELRGSESYRWLLVQKQLGLFRVLALAASPPSLAASFSLIHQWRTTHAILSRLCRMVLPSIMGHNVAG